MESLTSKFYGESEKRLSDALRSAEALGASFGGALVFLDEVDSLAGKRGGADGGASSDMHEATRRCLGVLLRHLDGFGEPGQASMSGAPVDALPPPGERKWSTLVAATNRPQDLDDALLSRFAASVAFPLPDTEERAAIFRTYASRALTDADVLHLASSSEGCSGRDIKDICESAERKHAARLIRSSESSPSAPPSSLYREALRARLSKVSKLF